MGYEWVNPADSMSAEECQAACTAQSGCLTMDYEKNERKCLLQNVTPLTAISTRWKTYNNNNYDFYQRNCQ